MYFILNKYFELVFISVKENKMATKITIMLRIWLKVLIYEKFINALNKSKEVGINSK